jgi:hypothetical protein
MVVGMQTAVDMKADIALFSAGGETSRMGLQNLQQQELLL